jgi:hypothetical protein
MLVMGAVNFPDFDLGIITFLTRVVVSAEPLEPLFTNQQKSLRVVSMCVKKFGDDNLFTHHVTRILD